MVRHDVTGFSTTVVFFPFCITFFSDLFLICNKLQFEAFRVGKGEAASSRMKQQKGGLVHIVSDA